MTTLIIIVAVIVAIIPVGMAIHYVMETQKTNWFIYYNKKKMKHFTKENASASKGQIVFIGDSIIDFYDLDKYLPNAKLKMYNRGISGDTTGNVLKRLDDNALTIEPNTLFLLAGTNDINKGVPDEKILENISNILDKVKSAGVEHIYVESMYPVNKNVDSRMVEIRTNEKICALNTLLKELAEDKGVTYINIHDSLTDENGDFNKNYTIDGLHPNAKGYEIVTDIIRTYVE